MSIGISKMLSLKINNTFNESWLKHMFEQVMDFDRKLDRPINDLDDIRIIMETQKKIRDQEIDMDMKIDLVIIINKYIWLNGHKILQVTLGNVYKNKLWSSLSERRGMRATVKVPSWVGIKPRSSRTVIKLATDLPHHIDLADVFSFLKVISFPLLSCLWRCILKSIPSYYKCLLIIIIMIYKIDMVIIVSYFHF